MKKPIKQPARPKKGAYNYPRKQISEELITTPRSTDKNRSLSPWFAQVSRSPRSMKSYSHVNLKVAPACLQLVLHPVAHLPARSRQKWEWTYWYQLLYLNRSIYTAPSATLAALYSSKSHFATLVLDIRLRRQQTQVSLGHHLMHY